jgi:MFS family permease
MIVAAGFVTMFMTCSIIFAYGIYQAIYEEMAKEPNTPFTGTSTSIISLIGTISIAIMSMGGPFAMTWAKLYGPQPVIMAGGVVFGLGCILASLSEYVWEFALTQGLLVGMGTCMAYVPTMSVAPTWFDKRRGLAMGIVISGSACGGMIWPPVLRAITSHLGFRNALRISGCLVALLVPLAGFTLRWEPTFKAKVRGQTAGLSKTTGWLMVPLVNWQVAKSKKFVAQALGCFLQSAGYATPLFFYAAFARSLGYSDAMGDTFITISNASNFISRIVIGYAADKFGRLNVLFLTTIMSSVAVFSFWLPATFAETSVSQTSADALFIVFTMLYGCFGSAYISLFPASLIELFGVQHFTSVNGALYLIRGMGAFLGTPLTGLLLPGQSALSAPFNYERVTITVGVLLFAASMATLWVRITGAAGKTWTWKL